VHDVDPTSAATDSPEAVVVFWRPGCGFCASLMFQLEKTELPLVEINIWDDARAAATVRSLANGNETVPTVVVGDVAMVNPSVNQVLDAVREHAPHLLGAGPS
jgi:glutaredoxin